MVERAGEDTRIRRVKAPWTAFFKGFDDEDRRQLSRANEVIGVSFDGVYTRVDFRDKWSRINILKRVEERFKGVRLSSSDLDVGIFEGDVSPLRRMLTDHPNVNISLEPRLGYFDIETDSRCTFAEAQDGKARTLSWAVVDPRGRERVEVLEEDTDEAERALLGRFFDYIRDLDVMLAWNGDGFDFPALENRIFSLRVKHSNGQTPTWNRWCWLDHMACFKKYNQAHESGEERSSFALEAIAQNLLGEGKHDFDASKTWQAWEAGGEQRGALAKYNLQDTKLLPKIEEKTGFIALHLAVCRVTRCVPDSVSLGAAQQGDGFLLRLGAAQAVPYRFATKVFRGEEEFARFAGAYVMEPKKLGAIDNVHVCDFASLYPSIMRSWNMSPDTYVPPFKAKALGSIVCKLPERNVHFRTDVRGIIPLALDQLIAQRSEYTKKADAAEPGSEDWNHYKRLSSAFKIVANSFYGIVGSPFTRFFDSNIAEGVTQTGAWLIKHVARTSENAGLIPFYGDTDSVFVEGDASTFSAVVGRLNESWPAVLEEMGCKESRVKLEYEKSFKRLVLVSAKRYAGKFAIYKGKVAPDDMKPEVKGLEYKRGDVVRLAREMQAIAIGMLLQPEMPGVGEFRAFVDEWRTRVLHGEVSREDLVLSQSVKGLNEYNERFTTTVCGTKIGKGKSAVKCGHVFNYGAAVNAKAETRCPKCGTERKIAAMPAHVRVAKILAARGEEVQEGTRIYYYVVDGDDDVKGLQAMPAGDPGAFEQVDRSYYWDKRIYPATKRLLEVVFPGRDWSADAVPKAKKGKASPAETIDSEGEDLARHVEGEKHVATLLRRRRVATADVLPLFADLNDEEVRDDDGID